jgi:lysophospholipase L1-like esterase
MIRALLRRLPVALLFLATAGLLAAAAAPRPPTLDLRDGDTLVFLGDSITHQCLYTQYVEDFFYTRHPERRIRFHNAGISGDRASDALARFDADVAAYRPKYVTVLLGMNDGQYEDFKAETFARYSADMVKLLDRIKAIGATAIVLSPTIFEYPVVEARKNDSTFRFRERSFAPNYNAVMAYYGAWGRDQAQRRGLPFVNLWGPLNDFTTEGRATDPAFTLVPDAIHPGPGGQFVMASALLEDLRPERRAVSAISVTRNGEKWTAAPALKLQGLDGDGTRVTFTHTAAALPWVIPAQSTATPTKWEWKEDARVGYELTKAGHRLSNEMLRVTGLAPGLYEVKIDGQAIGRPISHVVLGAKIELQANDTTPQYRQALQVAELNRERNDQAVRPLRDLWSTIKGARRKFAQDPAGFAAFMQKTQPEIDRLQQLARDYEARIHAAAQPRPHRYEITRVAAAPAPARGKKKS